MTEQIPKVVVLGAGFGGLTFCQHFRGNAQVTVVDRTNHYLFQPLLYQVAAAGLSAPEIAQPIRSILAKKKNVTVLLESVANIDLGKRQVALEKGTLDYDYLVMALGSCTSYFGHPEWEEFAPGLKTLEDALRIRSRVLLAFEQAETFMAEQAEVPATGHSNTAEIEQLLTIVIVGGGPTGLELAGAFAELTRTVLKRDFRRIDPAQARIILLEAAPRVLSNFPADLSTSALRQVEHLGVQVRTSRPVKAIRRGEVELGSGEIIHAENI